MDEIRDKLEALAQEKRTHVERRDALVQQALEAGMTLNDIARILGMTPQGLIKSRKKTNR